MSGLGAWIWGTSQLDDAIDKATSELLPAGGEDIALNLEICDQIRSKSAPAKDAMRALKRRLNHKNPNVQLLALGLTDICIKNGGDLFLVEIASREFMDNLVSILKIPALNHDVKSMILRVVQNWSIAFEGKPTLNYVGQVYRTLLNEGYNFPPKDLAVANSAMVDTQTAPEWIDSEVCLRCRTPFTFTNRKHHCRNCGQVFDQACSSKTMPLPHFGITQEVRVCDGCHSKLTKKAEKADKVHRHSTSPLGQRHKTARELADAELQRAIQLSLQEVNGKSGHYRPGYVPSQPSPSQWGYSEPPIVDHSTRPSERRPAVADDEDDPDLKAAIEASLREANAPKPSAPIVLETPRAEELSSTYGDSLQSGSYTPTPAQRPLPTISGYDLDPLEADAILTFNQTVEQVQAQGGRDLSRYPAVTELYDKASGLRPKLALSLDDAGRKEHMLSDMHDKLSQAVKLYDQILSQQVAQPRWRTTSSTVAPGSYQQAQQEYSAGYTSNGYSQWDPQAQPSQVGYRAPVEVPVSPSMSYALPPADTQPQYGSALTTESQWYPHQQASFQPQGQQQLTQYTSVSSPPASLPPTPLQSVQYTQSPYQPYSTNSTTSSIQSTPTFTHSTIPLQSPLASHYQPPAPQVPSTQPSASTNATTLGRHNSVAYASSPPASTPMFSHLSRSNTVASSTPQYQRQQQYQVQHSQQRQPAYGVASPAPAPTTLPQFPSVPTSAPQPTYSIYGSPPGLEQKEERKEALLIDL